MKEWIKDWGYAWYLGASLAFMDIHLWNIQWWLVVVPIVYLVNWRGRK